MRFKLQTILPHLLNYHTIRPEIAGKTQNVPQDSWFYYIDLKDIFFIVNFEHISHLVLVFLLLTLDMQLPSGYQLNFQFS